MRANPHPNAERRYLVRPDADGLLAATSFWWRVFGLDSSRHWAPPAFTRLR